MRASRFELDSAAPTTSNEAVVAALAAAAGGALAYGSEAQALLCSNFGPGRRAPSASVELLSARALAPRPPDCSPTNEASAPATPRSFWLGFVRASPELPALARSPRTRSTSSAHAREWAAAARPSRARLSAPPSSRSSSASRHSSTRRPCTRTVRRSLSPFQKSCSLTQPHPLTGYDQLDSPACMAFAIATFATGAFSGVLGILETLVSRWDHHEVTLKMALAVAAVRSLLSFCRLAGRPLTLTLCAARDPPQPRLHRLGPDRPLCDFQRRRVSCYRAGHRASASSFPPSLPPRSHSPRLLPSQFILVAIFLLIAPLAWATWAYFALLRELRLVGGPSGRAPLAASAAPMGSDGKLQRRGIGGDDIEMSLPHGRARRNSVAASSRAMGRYARVGGGGAGGEGSAWESASERSGLSSEEEEEEWERRRQERKRRGRA